MLLRLCFCETKIKHSLCHCTRMSERTGRVHFLCNTREAIFCGSGLGQREWVYTNEEGIVICFAKMGTPVVPAFDFAKTKKAKASSAAVQTTRHDARGLRPVMTRGQTQNSWRLQRPHSEADPGASGNKWCGRPMGGFPGLQESRPDLKGDGCNPVTTCIFPRS